MALSWNISDVKDCDSKCWIQDGGSTRLNPVTEALIWLTLVVDIGEITGKNYAEFFERCHMWESVVGQLLPGRPLTLADAYDHIGLSTNVSNRSKSVFNKRIISVLRDHAHRGYLEQCKTQK